MSSVPCSYGVMCNEPTCIFDHPTFRRVTACRYQKCVIPQCPLAHYPVKGFKRIIHYESKENIITEIQNGIEITKTVYESIPCKIEYVSNKKLRDENTKSKEIKSKEIKNESAKKRKHRRSKRKGKKINKPKLIQKPKLLERIDVDNMDLMQLHKNLADLEFKSLSYMIDKEIMEHSHKKLSLKFINELSDKIRLTNEIMNYIEIRIEYLEQNF